MNRTVDAAIGMPNATALVNGGSSTAQTFRAAARLSPSVIFDVHANGAVGVVVEPVFPGFLDHPGDRIGCGRRDLSQGAQVRLLEPDVLRRALHLEWQA